MLTVVGYAVLLLRGMYIAYLPSWIWLQRVLKFTLVLYN